MQRFTYYLPVFVIISSTTAMSHAAPRMGPDIPTPTVDEAIEGTRQHAQGQLGSKGDINSRLFGPAMSSTESFTTFDGKTTFKGNIMCGSEAPVVKVEAFPVGSLNGVGEINMRLSLDVQADGTVDATTTIYNVGGMCSNGYVRDCKPSGSYKDCQYCQWVYEDGNIKERCEKALPGKPQVFGMKGCFCFNRSCGSPIVSSMESALANAAMGLVDVVSRQNNLLAISRSEFSAGDMTLKMMGSKITDCSGVGEASPEIAELQGMYGKFDFPAEDALTNAKNDLNNPYNSINATFGKDPSVVLSCQDGAFKRVGITMGFREPAYMQDVTKDAWCLAGLGVDMSKSSVWGDGAAGGLASAGSNADTYYANTHGYYYNPLYILEILLDAKCLDKAPMAITDLSEIRPEHGDGPLNLMIYPQTLLFANPVSVAVCMADAIAATTGFPIDALFWCAGTWGTTYPLTGYSTLKGNTTVSAAANIAMKSVARAHNNLILFGTKGEGAMCGAYPQPVIMKSQYKIQPMRPRRTGSCVPIGRSEMLWGAFTNPPAPSKADNFAYLLWRWRDCCAF